MFQFFIDNYEAFLWWFITTMIICISVWIIGVLCGVILWFLWYYNKILELITDILYWFFISIPVIILLFWMHYPLQILLDIQVNPLITIVSTLSIVNILSVYKIVIQKIIIIKSNYSALWKTLWISNKNIILKIEIPLLFRKSIDQILSFQLNILHMSLFASFISVNDIFRVAQQLNASTYATVEIYTIIGIIFFIISIIMNLFISYIKNKYNYDYSW